MVLLAGWCGAGWAQETESLLSTELQIEQSGAGGLVVNWDIPGLDDNSSLQTLIAIPETGQPSVQTEVLRLDDRSAQQDGWDAGAPATLADASSELRYPDPRVTVKPLGFAGRCRIASIQVRPAVHKYTDGRSYRAVAEAGRAVLKWPQPVDLSESTREPRPFFDELLAAVVTNYPPPFSVRPPVSRETPGTPPVWLDGSAWRFTAGGEGFLELSWADIESIGKKNLDVRAEDIAAVSDRGTLPVLILDSQDSAVEERAISGSDRILIWVPKPDDPYTVHRTVTVYIQQGAGRAITADISPAPDTLTPATSETIFERDRIFYEDGSENENQDDYWMWEAIAPDATASIDLSIPDLSHQATQLHLDVSMRSRRAYTIDATPVWPQLLELNDTPLQVEVLRMQDRDIRHISAEIPAGLMRPGTNRVVIGFPSSSKAPVGNSDESQMYLDRIVLRAVETPGTIAPGAIVTVTAGRLRTLGGGIALDITDAWNPRVLRIENGEIAIPSGSGNPRRIVLANDKNNTLTPERRRPRNE